MAALIDRDREPSPGELRWFGALFLGFWTLFAGLAFARTGRPTLPICTWSFAALLTLAYYALPTLRRVMIRAWVTVTYPIGWLGSHLVLAVFFLAVLTPIALLMRAFGRDALNRRYEPERPSYWVAHGPPSSKERYWQQH